MKYSDYKVMIAREYERNRKNLFTCYFFLILSAVFFILFFFHVHELPVMGTAFLMDLAAAAYAMKAFKTMHPYWEMQLAIKARQEPSAEAVRRFTAGVEYALEHQLSAFQGRAPEIFAETLEAIRENGDILPEDRKRLEDVLRRADRS